MPLLDVLFPPRCAACDAADAWPLCGECTARVGVMLPPWCQRCGRPGERAVGACPDCPPPPLDLARSPFLYDGPIAQAIKAVKFGGLHGFLPHLARAMATTLGDPQADAITWVPLSRRRRSRRGFDQAELLARALAGCVGLPVRRMLVRARDAPSQARRSGADRRAALRGAFRTRGSPSPRVLLVDDVLTTGSTAAECASVLRAHGTTRVVLATAARSLGGPVPARCRTVAPAGAAGVP